MNGTLRHQAGAIRLTAWTAALALFAPVLASAAPITLRSGSGTDAAAIQSVVDLFRGDVGAVNNGNLAGSQGSGRREISWDGGGAAASATTFTSPMNTFNAGGTPRGAVFTTSGTGFEISGQPTPEFGDINATYPAIFQPFSSPRLFTPLGSNVFDTNFFIPGTTTPAAVFGFGAVFVDVDLANTTTVEFFNLSNVSLGVFAVPTFNNGLSFLGATFSDPISRVRVTLGNAAVGPNDAGGTDVVVVDDLIYSEPQAVPEPASVVLFGTGTAALLWIQRRRTRK